jgi:Fe/S biogenesis protein NfuA
MIQISESAQAHFRRILESQGDDAVGIRISAVHPGTPRADARLEFAEHGDLLGDEWEVQCEGFMLYVDAASARYLDDAEIDLTPQGAGMQLTIRAPRIKGVEPQAGASLIEKVQWLLDSEINPQLAAHKGEVALDSIDADRIVYLRFGGGCHGCGMADITLKQGIEKTLLAKIPEIAGIRDATDHASGQNPYVRR